MILLRLLLAFKKNYPFSERSDLKTFKSFLGFIVNPFLIDIISDSFKMLEEVSQFEVELFDFQEGQNLLILCKY